MRKILALATCFYLLMTATLQAQSFGGGFFLGPTVSQIGGDNLAGFDKLGALGGFYTHTRLSDNWRLQMELYLIRKGSRDGRDETLNTFYNATLNVVELPVIFQFDYSEKVFFVMGPALSTMVSTRETDIAGFNPGQVPFNRFSLTGIAGVGYRFNERLNFQWRGQWSLTPIRSREFTPPGAPWTDYFARGWRSLLLSFGFYYELGK